MNRFEFTLNYGGNVGVIIKKTNGEQVGMNRWTNIMPHFFKDINLYLGNTEQWYKDFSEQWLIMQEDYEKNKDTGNFQHNMTSVYFPHDCLSPEEYGIIAVDFKNKKIYSSQDYCNIGNLAFHHVWSGYEDNEDNIQLLQAYFNRGMIKFMQYYNPNIKQQQLVDISQLQFEDIIQFLTEMVDRDIETYSHITFKDIKKDKMSLYSSSFLINSDWQFFVHKDRSVGVLKVKKEMEKDGFVFSEEDNNQWKQYVSYQWSYLSEEELNEDETYQEFKKLYQEIFKEEFIHKSEE